MCDSRDSIWKCVLQWELEKFASPTLLNCSRILSTDSQMCLDTKFRYAFLPSYPTFLTYHIAKSSKTLDCYLHLHWKNSTISSPSNCPLLKLSCLQVPCAAGSLPFPFSCPPIPRTSRECTAALVWSRFLTRSPASCAWGREWQISIFPNNVRWWCSSGALLDHFGIASIGFN